MEKHQLSKSTFIRGVQCLKSLYLHKKRPYLRDRISAEQLAKFKRGTKVGILAQDIFPGGVDLRPKSPSQYQKCVVETKHYIQTESNNIIYEAGFQYNGVLILLDLLVKKKDGWHAYEVKSSLCISDTYIKDAALQYYVIKNSGIDLKSFNMIYVDKDYRLKNDLDLNDFFKIENITSQAAELLEKVDLMIEKEKEVINRDKSPVVHIGRQCNYPYPCDFQGVCWKGIKSNSVFDLFGASEEECFDLYHQGKVYIKEIAENNISSDLGKIALKSFQNNKEWINQSQLTNYLSKISSNPHYINILERKVAVPTLKGSKPYHPHVYFLQYGQKESNENKRELLIEPETDYRKDLLDVILNLFSSDSESIICYQKDNLTFQIDHLIEIFPEKERELSQIKDRIIDFFPIFNQGYFYHYSFKKDIDIFSTSKVLAKKRTYKKPMIRKDVLIQEEYLKIFKSNSEVNQEEPEEILNNYGLWYINALMQIHNNLFRLIK